MISGSAAARTSSAVMFSRTWAAFEAPVMTVETCGFFAHHARENCASETSEFVGDDLEGGHLLVSVFVGQHSLQPLVAGQRGARAFGHAVEVLAGQQPADNGDQIVVPSPMSS
jgi:hypothetical protein